MTFLPPYSLRRRLFATAAAAGVLAPAWVRAADPPFPARTVTLISPYAAGGTNDFLARLIAQRMGEVLKGTIVVDNRAGANGNVGAGVVAKALPDGYTLLMGNSATHGTNPTLYPNQPFSADKDFAPVGMVGSVPIVAVVHSGLNIGSVADLRAYARAHPGKLAFGSSGVGGTGHLCGEALKAAAGIDMVHVPYKGDAPAVADAMGGQVGLAFVGIASAASQAQGGKIRIIAVAHPRRVGSLPDVPTLGEAGFADMEFAQWYALFARAGTPAAVVERMNQATRTVLANPEVQKAMAPQGAEPTYMTPAQLQAFYQREIVRFREIIQRLNIKVGA
ncbi:tripartite tricarboxylate transporter substrate binding protein [uncultured Xylophilus sp.]|uniref:Bug family tripartite tricarboxylate transporter substrate binding protein n=1 Tax=uncultured Xylophilus sp. TaxID=296832 RepID=UPI0025FD82C2|nr:tripartite tricarboxylate transporter substrate binding protein [uncultured Xylophilus sp.]